MPKSQFTPAYRAFVEILTAARKEAGLNQTQLGERVGRLQTFISIIERGERRVDLIEFCALAKAMGHDPVELFERVYRVLPEKLSI